MVLRINLIVNISLAAFSFMEVSSRARDALSLERRSLRVLEGFRVIGRSEISA